MFLDHAVIAGVMTVGLLMVIYSGVGLFIWRDSPRRGRH
ncbi:cytochrome c oxidase subunit CcoM [Pseudomonas petrae]